MQTNQSIKPRIRALATAVPAIILDQADVESLGQRLFAARGATFERMRPVYANAGIDERYSCVDLDWYTQEHSWRERSRLFIENARKLTKQAAGECLEQAGLAPDDIGGIAVVSTTGVATPSLDALLIEDMGLRRDISRLPVFGLGCAGGVIGLNRVAELARGAPGKKWLFVVVELCGLTFRRADLSNSNIVATALFGDGAAAMVIDSDTDTGPAIICGGEHTWPGSLDVMGWQMQDDGFGVLFSRDIPDLVRTSFGDALAVFLNSAGISLSDIAEIVPHPGGAKVLTALEETMRLPFGSLDNAREILRQYGNMSAATVFFVLQRSLRNAAGGRRLLSALGPGFTAAFSVLEP
jgi:alkylresorcinol/alkylpyrone synthase